MIFITQDEYKLELKIEFRIFKSNSVFQRIRVMFAINDI